MTAAELLEAVAERIEAGEWGRGADGPCVMRLMMNLSEYRGYYFGVNDVALDALDSEVGGCIETWQDAPGRTREEIAVVVRNAIRRIRRVKGVGQ